MPLDGNEASFPDKKHEYSEVYFIGFTPNQEPVLVQKIPTLGLEIIRDAEYVQRMFNGADYETYRMHLLKKAMPELFYKEYNPDRRGPGFYQTIERSAFFIPLIGLSTEQSLMGLVSRPALPVSTLREAIQSGSAEYGIMVANERVGVGGGPVIVKIKKDEGFSVQTGGGRIEDTQYLRSLLTTPGKHDEFLGEFNVKFNELTRLL